VIYKTLTLKSFINLFDALNVVKLIYIFDILCFFECAETYGVVLHFKDLDRKDVLEVYSTTMKYLLCTPDFCGISSHVFYIEIFADFNS